MRKKIFTFLLALAASVGMMNAKVTWNSSNMSSFSISDTDQPYTLEGVTLRTNASLVMAYCDGNGDEIHFVSYDPDGFTFSNTLGKNFTKIEMFLTSSGEWGNANLGSGWSFMNNGPVTWTGNASTVDLLKGEADFGGASVKIVFHFEGDSQEPDPVLVTAYTLQLVADPIKGSVAVTNLLGSGIVDNGDGTYDVPEGAEVTLQATPNEGYEFIGWKAGSVGCDFTDCGNALSTVDNPLTFDMYQEAAFMAEFAAVAPQPVGDGKLPGAFSVSASKKVNFSQGNLRATTADNGTTWTWAFAANQLTFVGNATANTAINGNGTVSANGTVDLFGWSTAATKYGINNSLSNSTYSGDFVDWGSNPDLIASLGEGWRTLTSAEWTYLLNTRTTTSGVRYAKAIVDGKNGLIILPDDWSESYHALASANTDDVAYTYNTFDAAIWSSDFEAHGAVFLPAAGYRRGKDVDHLGVFANYWSASPDGAEYAYYLSFNESLLYPAYNYNRVTGEAVRLVSDIPQYTITPNEDPKNTGVYYSTFFDSSVKYELPAGVEAYVADLSGANLLLTKIAEAGEVIPANVAVILKSTVTPFTLAVSDAEAVTFTATNDLQGSDTQIATPANCYVLAGTDGVVGFYHYTAANLNAHKAYVVYSGSNQAPRRMPFVFDQATGVENVQNSDIRSQKVVENGQLIIIRNGIRYNAAGQIVK